MLGNDLEPCGTDPVTGFYRDGCCTTGPEDAGSHTICRGGECGVPRAPSDIGNDLSTPMPRTASPVSSPEIAGA